MNTLLASPGRQFVRSPGLQRVAGNQYFAIEGETLVFQKPTAGQVQELLYGIAAIPFSILPAKLQPIITPEQVFRYPTTSTYGNVTTADGQQTNIQTNPGANGYPTVIGVGFVEMDACFYSETPVWATYPFGYYPEPLNKIVLEQAQQGTLPQVSHFSHTVPFVYNPISPPIGGHQWYGRRSRFRTSRPVSAWQASCDLRHITPTFPNPFVFQHVIENIRVTSRFTQPAFQWFEVPLPLGDDGSLLENRGNFVILGESPEQWSTRTGIPITG